MGVVTDLTRLKSWWRRPWASPARRMRGGAGAGGVAAIGAAGFWPFGHDDEGGIERPLDL
jgi:hypothetical protein